MKKTYSYKTKGVCSSGIDITLDENNIVKNVTFHGGCSGNTQGVSKLIVGMPAQEAVARLGGIRCGFKNTSCPDQLSKALQQMLQEKSEG